LSNKANDFHHPNDTIVSSTLRFASEIIVWVSGPWAVGRISIWLSIPVLVLLVGLPSVFSTEGDKRHVVVKTPGSLRVALELFLYSVGVVAPWFIWSETASIIAVAVVSLSIIVGFPRMIWLIRGAPTQMPNNPGEATSAEAVAPDI
jgi:hypothetical protein